MHDSCRTWINNAIRLVLYGKFSKILNENGVVPVRTEGCLYRIEKDREEEISGNDTF